MLAGAQGLLLVLQLFDHMVEAVPQAADFIGARDLGAGIVEPGGELVGGLFDERQTAGNQALIEQAEHNAQDQQQGQHFGQKQPGVVLDQAQGVTKVKTHQQGVLGLIVQRVDRQETFAGLCQPLALAAGQQALQADVIQPALLRQLQAQAGGGDDLLVLVEDCRPANVFQAAEIGQFGVQLFHAPLTQVVGQAALLQGQHLPGVLAPAFQGLAFAARQLDAQQQQAEQQGKQAEQQRQRAAQRIAGQHGAPAQVGSMAWVSAGLLCRRRLNR